MWSGWGLGSWVGGQAHGGGGLPEREDGSKVQLCVNNWA